MAKVTIDGLGDAISGILEEYADEVSRGTKECVRKVARAGVSALRSASPKKTGEYASGWTSKVEEGRLTAKATLHNRHPGLPHLLEHGHVSRNGTGRTFGRVAGREHIAPVEAQLVESFEQEIEVKLS